MYHPDNITTSKLFAIGHKQISFIMNCHIKNYISSICSKNKVKSIQDEDEMALYKNESQCLEYRRQRSNTNIKIGSKRIAVRTAIQCSQNSNIQCSQNSNTMQSEQQHTMQSETQKYQAIKSRSEIINSLDEQEQEQQTYQCTYCKHQFQQPELHLHLSRQCHLRQLKIMENDKENCDCSVQAGQYSITDRPSYHRNTCHLLAIPKKRYSQLFREEQRLNQHQISLLGDIYFKSARSLQYKQALLQKMQSLAFTEQDLQKLTQYIQYHAPLLVGFHFRGNQCHQFIQETHPIRSQPAKLMFWKADLGEILNRQNSYQKCCCLHKELQILSKSEKGHYHEHEDQVQNQQQFECYAKLKDHVRTRSVIINQRNQSKHQPLNCCYDMLLHLELTKLQKIVKMVLGEVTFEDYSVFEQPIQIYGALDIESDIEQVYVREQMLQKYMKDFDKLKKHAKIKVTPIPGQRVTNTKRI